MIETIVGGVALAVLGWFWVAGRSWNDRRRVHAWLKANTRDEPGKSHRPTAEIAKGTQLNEDRARAACLKERRIFRNAAPDGSETWSVWRGEPERRYQVFTLGGRR
jgi:hypothetical protein